MAEFNEQFGNLVTLEVIDNNIAAKFNANPQEVAENSLNWVVQTEWRSFLE